MYIKNIGELIKDQLPLKLRFFEGNSVHGKVISLEDGKGAIKLYDGTIIPAIFINENNLEKNKFTKFVIQDVDSETLVLKAVALQDDISDEKSIEWILKDLNIPLDKGKDIISSLLKFNIPASDDNINFIYKNIKFLDNLKNMSDADVLTFLQKNINSNITQNSNEFICCKQIISTLKNINCDFLTFLIQNDIPLNIENILKTKDFVDNNFFMNSLIDDFKENIIKTKSELSNDNSPTLYNIIRNVGNNHKNSGISNNDASIIINNIDIIKILHDEHGIDNLKTLSNDELTQYLTKDKNIKLKTENVEIIKNFLNNLTEEQTTLLNSILKSDEFTSKQEVNINEFLNKIKEHSFINSNGTKLCLEDLKNTLDLDGDTQLFNFIKTNIDKNIVKGSDNFNNIKQLITALQNNTTIENFKSVDLFDNKNDIINISNIKFSKTLVMDILGKLNNNIKPEQGNINIVSLNDMIKTIQHNPDMIKDINSDSLKNFINNIDILKNIDKNYNFYHFNLYNNQDILKNTIIIKNKYKSSKYIDVNDVKVFISVDTSSLGTIEGYLYKKYKDLFITLNAHEDNIKFIKDNLYLLKSNLSNKGYNVIDISVDKVVTEFDIINLSTFFNDGIFNELDVKV